MSGSALQRQEQNRFLLLDVARGVAAVLVVIHHCFRATPGYNSARFETLKELDLTWTSFVLLGSFAVSLFFVLSGASFGLSLGTPERFETRAFYIKRFFRIYPAYLLSILAYWTFRPIYGLIREPGLSDWLSPQFANEPGLLGWVTYLTMTFNLAGTPQCFNTVLWSLPIEVQFYLFFPLLVACLRPTNRWAGNALVIGLCGCAWLVGTATHTPGGTLQRLWEFGGGLLIGVNRQPIARLLASKFAASVVLIAACALFLIPRVGPISLGPMPANTFDVLCGFGIVASCAGPSRWQPSSGAGRILVATGAYSYSLYLFHSLFIGLVAPIGYSLASDWHPGAFFPILLAVVLPASWLLARQLFRVESAFIDLGRRLARPANRPTPR